MRPKAISEEKLDVDVVDVEVGQSTVGRSMGSSQTSGVALFLPWRLFLSFD